MYGLDWSNQDHEWFPNFAERFAYYGSGGLFDPKMPAEAYLYRTGSLRGITTRAGWAALGVRGFAIGAGLSLAGAIVGLGFAGAVLDPFNVNEGGLDEYYRPVVNAFFEATEPSSTLSSWYPS